MYINRHNKVVRQFGFSLWELSLVMLIMVGLFVALVNIMPHIVKRDNVTLDNTILVKVDEQILGFIATYNRLPYPDSNSDGLEDASASSGTLPYKTLGLNEDYAGTGSIPLVYAVYRNSAVSADLANITNIFNPTDSHGTTTTFNHTNGLDFCTALVNGATAAFSASFAHIVLPSGAKKSIPYIIVSAGLADKDGNLNPFDGRNASIALDFESVNRIQDGNYDDVVLSKTFEELAQSLNCDTAINSLNLLADAKATHVENVVQAQSIKEAVELSIVITIMQTALGVTNTAIAVYNLGFAAGLVGVASASLGLAIIACLASFGTACGGVAIAAAGLAAAVAAVVAAGVSVGLNVAALVAQTTAIVKTIDVAHRAGSTITPPNPNIVIDPDTGVVVTTNSDLAAQARATAEMLKKDAAEKVIAARTSINDARSLALSIRNRFNTLKSETQALFNTNAAVGDVLFSSHTTAANNQAQANLNQANAAIVGLNNALGYANNAVTAVGSAVSTPDPNNPLGPPIISYPNADFPLASSNLQLAEPETTTASTEFANLNNSYLATKTSAINAKNRIIVIRNALPPLPANATQAQINARNAYLAILTDAETKANSVIARIDEVFINPLDANYLANIFSTWIGTELGQINAAQGQTTDALETIRGALDAEASAVELENAVGNNNPPPTTSVLNLSTGVDDILKAADKKGVQQ